MNFENFIKEAKKDPKFKEFYEAEFKKYNKEKFEMCPWDCRSKREHTREQWAEHLASAMVRGW